MSGDPSAALAAGAARAALPAWHVRDRVLRAGTAPLLMGIVNTTPDSFSDGGLHLAPEAAVAHGQRCADEGAAVLDVGGESTRPGAARVPAEAQVARVVPVIARLVAAGHSLSVDTTRAAVARAALQAGAHAVNDVSGATEDDDMLAVVAEARCGVILMHRRAPPGEDRYSDQHLSPPHYADVVRDVRDWLAARAEAALRAGVARERIALDPGLGFGKDVAQNLRLVAELPVLVALGHPVVIGASRKSFVGAVSGARGPGERLAGSLAVALAAAAGGAAILRVHDVAPHREALAAWSAVGAARQR